MIPGRTHTANLEETIIQHMSFPGMVHILIQVLYIPNHLSAIYKITGGPGNIYLKNKGLLFSRNRFFRKEIYLLSGASHFTEQADTQKDKR